MLRLSDAHIALCFLDDVAQAGRDLHALTHRKAQPVGLVMVMGGWVGAKETDKTREEEREERGEKRPAGQGCSKHALMP